MIPNNILCVGVNVRAGYWINALRVLQDYTTEFLLHAIRTKFPDWLEKSVTARNLLLLRGFVLRPPNKTSTGI
jgi:hypothetical protein